MKKHWALFFFFLFFSNISDSYARVSKRSGSFGKEFVDLVLLTESGNIQMYRTYRSSTSHRGLFGHGFGGPYETFLRPGLDGAIYVFEKGSGDERAFVSSQGRDIEGAVEKIIQELLKKERATAEEVAALKKSLRRHSALRRQYARSLKLKTTFAEQKKFRWQDQTLIRKKEGFERKIEGVKTERFNLEGKLKEIAWDRGKTLRLSYDQKTGRLKKVQDKNKNALNFTWGPQGLVTKVTSSAGLSAEYSYQKKQLQWSKDSTGAKTQYGFTNRRLSLIDPPGEGKIQVSYNKQGLVQSYQDFAGREWSYSYQQDPQKPHLKFSTSIVEKRGKEERSWQESFELKEEKGRRYLYRKLIQGPKKRDVETIYNSGNRPIKVRRGDEVTTFRYDDQGRPVEKKSPDDHMKMSYDPKWGKLASLESKVFGNLTYSYNQQGKIDSVASSHYTIKLLYNRKGQISAFVKKDKLQNKTTKLAIRYNSTGRPIEIKAEGKGTLRLEYDRFGNVLKASQDKPQTQQEIQQAFNRLVDMLRPAGMAL